jgi:hypothetical protein
MDSITQTMLVQFLGENRKAIPTADATAYYSDPIDCRWIDGDGFALRMQLDGAGPDIKIEYQVAEQVIFGNSYLRENLNEPFVTPDGAAAIDSSVADTNLHVIPFSVDGAAKFIRLKITGNAGNGADTVFTGVLQVQ